MPVNPNQPTNGMCRRNYLFMRNIMEEILEIKRVVEILVNDIKIYTIA